jgi:hypothetical protein
MAQRLQEGVPGVTFNGEALGKSLYTVLNVQFPDNGQGDMFLFNLDIAGVSASGGSACSSSRKPRNSTGLGERAVPAMMPSTPRAGKGPAPNTSVDETAMLHTLTNPRIIMGARMFPEPRSAAPWED